MYFKRLCFLLLVIFQLSSLQCRNGFVSAQANDITDEEDDVEVDVDDVHIEPEIGDGAVSEKGVEDDEEEEEAEDTPLKPSPDADTTFLFTQPSGLGLELPAGKDVHFLVGFANRGSKDFVVEAMDASFRYPLDFSFHIQNFSAISYNRVVKPKQEITLYYAFYTSETFSSRPFGLTVNLYYKDTEGYQYLDAVFNETITIVEVDESLDGETFFLYVFLAACVVLLFVAAQQFLTSFTRKKTSASQK